MTPETTDTSFQHLQFVGRSADEESVAPRLTSRPKRVEAPAAPLPFGENGAPLRTALVGRQAIFDRSEKVWAYQLLYRSSQVDAATFTSAAQATATVILNAFIEIGLERVVGEHRVLI